MDCPRKGKGIHIMCSFFSNRMNLLNLFIYLFYREMKDHIFHGDSFFSTNIATLQNLFKMCKP